MNDPAQIQSEQVSAGMAYESNATLDEIVGLLRASQRLALLTHTKPDGDAIGSTLALARTLTHLGAEATPVYLPPWLRRLDPLIGSTKVIHEKHRCWEKPPLSKVDRVAVVDTGTWSQVAGARPYLQQHREHTIIIDHHAHGDPEMAPLRYIDVNAAASAQIVAELCCMLLHIESAADLPTEIAEPLYVGLTTDTGWFRYSNTSPSALRLGADLINAGADHSRLYAMIEQNDSPSRIRLIQHALASMELLSKDRAALMTITRRDIEDCHAGQDELGGLSDLPQTIGTVRVVAVITELNDKVTKVSLRSKPGPEPGSGIDVNQMARSLGGGGHIHAAGAKIDLPLAEAHAKVVDVLTRAVES